MEYKDLTHTHWLRCKHCVGSNNCKNYLMPCNVLKTMPDGRLKVEVYGNLYWKNKYETKKVRYVHASKVIQKEQP